jgi:hypothetical protein
MSNVEEQDRRTLWEQFCEVHAKQQESYDSSIRALAAAGVAVTVSLGTALDGLTGLGTTAVILFLLSLGLNLVSYVTSQRDMTAPLNALRDEGLTEAVEGNCWTVATTLLNVAAGVALVGGGAFLAWFV